jgi:hypothetical protein
MFLASARWHVYRALPDELAVTLRYVKAHKRFPRLKNPKRFTEKIQAIKLRRDPSVFAPWADKIAVKTMVSDLIGPQFVIPTFYAGKALPPILLRDWPLPFVIKANHGSGWNIFVRQDADKDWAAIDALLALFLCTDYGIYSRERWYSKIERRVLVEPLLLTNGAIPLDYKIFVFAGRPTIIQVDTGRFSEHKRSFFDVDWRPLPFKFLYEPAQDTLTRPPTLDLMLSLAERIARQIDLGFVRVDFYEIDGKVYFGEVTFGPEGGLARFEPDLWDFRLGAMWRWP